MTRLWIVRMLSTDICCCCRWDCLDASTLEEPFQRDGNSSAVDSKGRHVRIHANTREILSALRKSGKRIAVASLNQNRNRCISLLKACEFWSLLFVLILSPYYQNLDVSLHVQNHECSWAVGIYQRGACECDPGLEFSKEVPL